MTDFYYLNFSHAVDSYDLQDLVKGVDPVTTFQLPLF